MTLAHPARAALALASVAAVAVLATGCGGSSGTTTAAAQPTTTATYAIPTCPGTGRAATVAWPDPVPQDLPKPPGSTAATSTSHTGQLTIVRFDADISLREAVLFVVKQLPQKGFTLGRGDAEAAEADAPFVRGDTRGLIRMAVRDQCRTEFLVAVADAGRSGTSPLLPTHPASGSPSPLPFAP